jgi:uncharacterized UBP type Zn finger protein
MIPDRPDVGRKRTPNEPPPNGGQEDQMTACLHVDQLGDANPSPNTPDGCEECLAAGDRWVHLRLCLSCGHVGCCDSSVHRHASAHHRETGHPVMRSFEPGENWRWCFEDQTIV